MQRGKSQTVTNPLSNSNGVSYQSSRDMVVSIENNTQKINQFAPLFFFKTPNASLIGEKKGRVKFIPTQLVQCRSRKINGRADQG